MRSKNGAVRCAVLLISVGLLGASGPTGASAATGSGVTGATKPASGVSHACPNTRLRPTHTNTRLIDAAILCLTDRERARRKLRALRPNHDLQSLAQSQTREMVMGNYFGDLNRAGQTPWQRVTTSPYASGAHSLSAAQNIGCGSGRLVTPAAMMSGWMHSPEHRQIVLTAGYRDVGIGVAPLAPHSSSDGLPGATYTVEFATRG